eukprot:TRINITY_DN9633_c0_g1_i1.p1 TRINITY_DN9633_c0_g1~~TRINITY_DN9633_c0_g1_i1.p1  ORF type:complete len:709 (-),score=216.83 TRINITY_DN9633_c0_g1_i1:16-1968(-)
MTDEEVNLYREDKLEGVKIRGKNCPKPIMRWTQCGLPARIFDIIQKCNYSVPFPIQAQAIPAIMSGRDVIACAKTGSGKTLAFLLPLFRHIMDQPPLDINDGPIGLILAPTRELAIQIATEAKKFAKTVNVRVVCCYGGTGVAEQIANLKRGAEIVVATPGRMIDMLCANQGRVTNLRRTTFVCLDEADRMFDMGFEPQISMILMNVRPDRQTVMFSATFPKQIEGLAKRALTQPLEIIIGGRSTASNTVNQRVEIFSDESSKFDRLIQLLSEWTNKGLILIFTDKQENVDNLFSRLMKSGFLCYTLHGGMDQADRDYTILDFKKQTRRILVATSVAARGLDVKELVLVVNYAPPHHYEDYIHRIGRTGRAGAEGNAITFITTQDEHIAPELVKALESGKQEVPIQLLEMATSFEEKKKSGQIRFGSNQGYSTTGFKFDEKEAQKKIEDMKRQKKVYAPEDDQDSGDSDVEMEHESETPQLKSTGASSSIADDLMNIKKITSILKTVSNAKASAAEKVSSLNVAMTMKQEITKQQSGASASSNSTATEEGDYFTEEVEINDYPQAARWKVTAKGSTDDVQEMCDVAITTKGSYVAPPRKPGVGERKLYLLIEGKTRVSVNRAKREIVGRLEEAAMAAKPDDNAYTKYSVV